jgi:adenylosuccinate synthase
MGVSNLESFQPVYETLAGWTADLTSVRQWNDLPPQAQEYIRSIEKLTGIPVSMVSVGPERSQTVEVPA